MNDQFSQLALYIVTIH